MVWADLIGQESAVRTLQAAVAAAGAVHRGATVDTGAMTHAWLFTGPAGSGRSIAGRAFAAALQCENGTGCGSCPACRTVLAGTHPDVRRIVPEGLSISVKEMREVVGLAARRPAMGRWQVVLIEDADRLTEGAANALLKAIEEPPPRTVFLLCAPSTHPDDVPLTIRSRCRVVPLRTPPAASIAAALVAEGVEDDTALWAAHASQGHVGRARRLAWDTETRERRAAVLAVPARLSSLAAVLDAAEKFVAAAETEAASATTEVDAEELADLQRALGMGGTGKGVAAAVRGSAGAIKELEKRQKSRATRSQRDALDRALVDLAAFYRDVLMLHSGAPVAPAHPDFDGDVRAVARRLSPAETLKRLEAVLNCREALELNVKPRIAVEALTASLRLPVS